MRLILVDVIPLRDPNRVGAIVHVRLPDVGLEIRGVRVLYGDDRWHVRVPRESVRGRDGSPALKDVLAFDPDHWREFSDAVLAGVCARLQPKRPDRVEANAS